MTKTHSTRRALGLSVLALVLCFSMLLGTTFAWFTDTATTGVNKIQAGTLKIDLLHKVDNDWVSVKENPTHAIWDYAYWEPGYTQYETVKIVNKGTLALKYILQVVSENEVAGEKGALLSEVIDVYVAEADAAEPTSFANISGNTDWENVGTLKSLFTNPNGIVKGYLNSADQATADASLAFEREIKIALHMREEAGNEYQGLSLGDLYVNLFATQYTYEFDSFDDQYDADSFYYDAKVTDAASLMDAVRAGNKTIAIEGKIVLTGSFGANDVKLVGIGDGAGIDFGTYGISGNNVTYENLSLDNDRDGWYKGMQYSDAENTTYINCVIENGVTTYGKTSFYGCTFNELPAGNYALFIYDGGDIIVDNCTFEYGNRAIKIYNEGHCPNMTLTLKNSTFTYSTTSVLNKALIEIDDSLMTGVIATVDNITVDTALSGAGVYRINDGTLDTSTDKSKVTVNGVTSASFETVTDADELKDVLSGAGASGAGNTIITFSGDDIDLTNETWEPVYVNGYTGADIITIDGNGATLKGLTAPLFSGGFAGGSGIIIKNLTIEDANIDMAEAYSGTGVGAFVCAVDSMDVITLENCHLLNSTVEGSRTGGLIGWTSGYDVTTDGPVDSYINIKNCSVIGCTIIGNGTAGAINGHAGCNPATYTTIEDCVIMNNEIISYDDSYRVGVVVGTANVGEVIINNITESGNVVKQINGSEEIARPDGQSSLYGRFVPNSTGKLTIDGVSIN